MHISRGAVLDQITREGLRVRLGSNLFLNRIKQMKTSVGDFCERDDGKGSFAWVDR